MDNSEGVEAIPMLLKPSAEEITVLMSAINQRQFQEAEALAKSIAMRFPLQVLGWKVLGNVLNEMGKYEDALLPIKMVVILSPYDAEANTNYGLQLKLLGRFEEAEASCRLAVQYDPRLIDAHHNLALTLLEMERLEEAEASFLKVIEYDPNHPYAYNSLGVISSALGRPNNDYFDKAIIMAPDFGDIHSNWVYYSTLTPSIDATTLFNKHLRYAEIFEAPFISQWQPHGNDKDPHRCLQIGFVSGDLCGHVLIHSLEPILIHLSSFSALSLHAYYNNTKQDAFSDRLQGYFKSWTSVAHLGFIELAEKIRGDNIDILIDLSGHTAKNRLLSFARKPAPIQVTWMGYPGTTGLKSMDYIFVDRFFTLKHLFTEKLVYLPAAAPFNSPVAAPDVNTLPALKNGYITFGSFNRVVKYNARVVAVWAKLMQALPTSRLRLNWIPESSNDIIIAWFEECGIQQDRLSFHPRSNNDNFLELHQEVDIGLDTFPYGGSTTTCQALWMGVPTLTMVEETIASRMASIWLNQVGSNDYIAVNEDDFVNKGLSAANDLERLAKLRMELRTRFKQSPIQQPELIAKNVEHAFRYMWQRWCDDLPPISFDVSDTQISPEVGVE